MSKKDVDLYDKVFGDANERFVGEVLNEEKMKALTMLRKICADLAERDRQIKYKAYPFSNRSQNGTVILDLPQVAFCTDKRVMRGIADALSIADDVGTSVLGNGLRISFGIQDMWKDFHYEESKE